MTDLSVVVLSWNARDVLLACLASLVPAARDSGLATELIVVDNGSQDGSARAVAERFPGVRLVALPENLGFSAGNNRGLRLAQGRVVLLLNSDTLVTADALARCVAWLDAHPRVGILGPALLHPDGRLQTSVHALPSLATELVPGGLLRLLDPEHHPAKRPAGDAARRVPAVLGAALFVRRAVLEQVGLLPEDHFLFLEETDLCLRAARAGWEVVQLPAARIVHLYGASSKAKLPAETRIEFQRSLFHFLAKHRGPASAAVARVWRAAKALLYVAWRAPAALLSRRRRERWGQDRTVLSWYLRGCPEDWGIPGRRHAAGGDPAPPLKEVR